jgi:hypothetical protein
MAAGTEFVLATRTGEPIQYLEAADRKWATYLDPAKDTASCTVRMDQVDPDHLAAGQCELAVYRGGNLVWTGPIWKLQPDYSTGRVAVVAAGLASYMADRILLDHPGLLATDLADLFAYLLDQLTDPLGRGDVELAITCPTPTATGVLADGDWNNPAVGEDYPYLLPLVAGLAAGLDGFDWTISPDRVARMWYPRRGQALDLPLEHGANCTVEPFEIDASPGTMGTEAFGFGGGSGPDQLIAYATASALYPAYGVRTLKLSGDSDATYEELLAATRSYLTRRARPRMVPAIMLRPDTEPGIGDFDLGDTLPVRATRGEWSLAADYRVIGLEVELDQAGGEGVRLLLADPAEPETEESST